ETISRFLVKAADTLGGDEFTVVEPGAGRGLLASDILGSLRENAPELYRRTSYVMIERSPAMISLAEALLGGHGGRVRFVQSLGALGPESVTGVVLSNELMDALPFRRARFEGGSLSEILVALQDG